MGAGVAPVLPLEAIAARLHLRPRDHTKGFSPESIFSATRTRLPHYRGRTLGVPRARELEHCRLTRLPPSPPAGASAGASSGVLGRAAGASLRWPGMCPLPRAPLSGWQPAGASAGVLGGGRRRRVCAGRARALLAPLHLAGGAPSVWAEAAALQQTQHYFSFSFSFCLFVHLNVYLELHFVKNLPLLFLFPS